MQIARLAVFEVNEKTRGRCAATKAFGHEGTQPWAAPLGMSAPIAGRKREPISNYSEQRGAAFGAKPDAQLQGSLSKVCT